MDLKHKILIISLVLLLSLSISIVSANENTSDVQNTVEQDTSTVSIDQDTTAESIASNQNDANDNNDGSVCDALSTNENTTDSNSQKLSNTNQPLLGADFTTLQGEITNNYGGVLNLTKDYKFDSSNYDYDSIEIYDEITINGNGHIIDGKDAWRIFNIYYSGVVLNNITFMNNFAINSYDQDFIINNCTFINTYSDYNGGAIYLYDSNVNLTNCKFINSTSVTSSDNSGGGAIYIEGGKVNIVNCSFKNTSTSCNSDEHIGGGAIYITNSEVNITDCKFTDTSASCINGGNSGGGAVFIKESTANFTNCKFSNTSTYSENSYSGGGSVLTYRSTIDFTNCSFNTTRASARGEGGAIYGRNSKCNFYNCNFTDNLAFEDGGAIALYAYDYGYTSIIGTIFINCSFINVHCNVTGSTPYGGAIYFDYGMEDIIISNCDFINTSIYGNGFTCGGAITFNDYCDNISISNCDFINTSAVGCGGAIYMADYISNINITNCNFINNKLNSTDYAEGGAICGSYADNFFMANCTFINSSIVGDGSQGGSLSGGAIHFYAPQYATVFNCTFINSSASGQGANGGAAYVADNTYLLNCTFINSSVTGQDSHGNALYLGQSSSDVHIEYCNFINTAGDDIYLHDAYTYLNGNSLDTFITMGEWETGHFNSETKILILNGTNLYENKNKEVNITVIITDDNNNLIIFPEATLAEITINPGVTRPLNYNNNTGIYWCTYSFPENGAYSLNTSDIKGWSLLNLTNNGIDAKINLDFWLLQEQIDDTPAGGVVTLTRDYKYGGSQDKNKVNITKPITINGNGHIIDADLATHIFDIDVDAGSVVINDCILKGVQGSELGETIIHINKSNVEISGCDFLDSTTQENGCGICNDEGDVTLANCNFENLYSIRGGAIYNTGNVTMFNCNFTDIISSSQGGVIYNDEGNISILNTHFENVESYGDGGVIYTYDGQVNFTDCEVITSSAGSEGGGVIFSQSGNKINLINCSFEDITSPTGAINNYDYEGEINMINCNFTNTYGQFGGTIQNSGKIDLSNCRFTDISAYSGGAIKSYGDMNLSNCIFTNISSDYDGAVYCSGGEVNMINCTFVDTHVSDNYTVYLGYSDIVFLSKNIIDGNIYFDNSQSYFNSKTYVTILDNSTVRAHKGESIYIYATFTDDNNNIILSDSSLISEFTSDEGTIYPYYDLNTGIYYEYYTFTYRGKHIIGANYDDSILTNATVLKGTVSLPLNFEELQRLINETDEGGVLDLDYNFEYDGYGDVDPIVINKAITINGNNRIIDANDAPQIFYINTTGNVVIKDCVLTGIENDWNYGNDNTMVYIEKGNVNLVNCSFENASSCSGGSAVHVNPGNNLTITNCSFSNLDEDYSSGCAIYNDGNIAMFNCSFENTVNYYSTINNNGHMTLSNCSFENIQNSGYAINNYYGDASLYDCDFIGISSYSNGAAVYNENGNITLTDCNFIAISGGEYGGAIYSRDGNVGLYECDFSSISGSKGGAIYIENGINNISHCNFENINSYSASVYLSTGNNTLTNCNFNNCYSDEHGNIFGYFSNVTVSNCNILNSTTNYNCPIEFDSGNAIVNNCKVINCTSNREDCDIGIYYAAIVSFSNNTLDNSIYFEVGSYAQIISPTYIVILNNSTVIANHNEDVTIQAILKDDNNNTILSMGLLLDEFVVDGYTVTLDYNNYNYTTGIYTKEYYFWEGGAHSISANYDSAHITDVNVLKGTVSIPCNFQDLQNLIDNAYYSGEDTVNLSYDYYYEGYNDIDHITIPCGMTINGNNHIIDAQNGAQIFYINTDEKVVINDCDFRNSVYVYNDGGVIHSEYGDGDFTLFNCSITNVTSPSAIYSAYSNANISNCAFVNISGDYGAIYSYEGNITLYKSSFTNTDSNGRGSAVYISNTNAEISDCTFENTVSPNNDTIYITGSKVFLSKNTLDNYIYLESNNITSQTFITFINSPIRGSKNTDINITAVITDDNNNIIITPNALITRFNLSDGSEIIPTYNINTGIYWAIHQFADDGVYKVNASYLKSPLLPNLTSLCGFIIIGNVDVNTTIDATINSVTYPSNATASINVLHLADGIINITVDGKTFTTTVLNGKAIVNLTGLSAGDKNALIEFTTTDGFNNDTSIIYPFTILKGTPYLTITNTDFDLVVESNYAIGDVLIIVNNENQTFTFDDTHRVVWPDILKYADNYIFIYYPGNENFTSYLNHTKITIPKLDPGLEITNPENNSVHYTGERFAITITNNTAVNLTVNGVKYEVNNGNVVIDTTKLDAGEYIITLSNLENEEYLGNTISHKFTIKKYTAVIDSIIVPTTNVTAGQAALIEVIMDNVTSGTISIEVGGQNYTVAINQGTARLSVVLPNGTYRPVAYFTGDANYTAANKTSDNEFNVVGSHEMANIIINAPSSVEIDKDLVFTVTNSTPVVVTIGNKTIDLVDGKYTYHATATGNYTIIARPADNSAGFNSTAFNVFKHNTTLEITGVNNITYSIGSTFTVTVTTNSSSSINVTINGKSYAVDTNGIVDLDSTTLTSGHYVIIATVSENGNYTAKSATKEFTIEKHNAVIESVVVPTDDIIVGQEALITVTMDNVTSGTILIEVAGRNYTVAINNKVATLTVTLPKGTYNATAYYLGDNNYNPKTLTNTTKFNVVDKQDAIIIINAPNRIEIDENLVFNITNNTPVIVTIGDTVIPCINGNYTFPALTAGDYTIIARAAETDTTSTGFNSTKFTVYKHTTTVDIRGITNGKTYTAGSTFDISVVTNSDSLGFIVSVNDKIYPAFNNTSIGLDSRSLSEGKYIVSVIIYETEHYTANADSKTFNIIRNNATLEINGVTNGSTYAVGTVFSINATSNSSAEPVITINGKTYIADTQIVLGAGHYIVTATVEENNNFTGKTVTVEFDVAKHNAIIESVIVPTSDITVGQDATITVNMDNVTTGTVLIEIAGRNYTVPINNKIATLTVALPKGTYNATAYYLGDNNYNPKTLTNTTKFNVVDKQDATIIINAPSVIVIGNKLVFNMTNNTPVVVTIGNETINLGADGNYTVEGLTSGSYTIIAKSAETNEYNAGFNSTEFRVVKHNATLAINNINDGSTYAVGTVFTINTTTSSTEAAVITINGKSYIVNTPEVLGAGHYIVTATVAENNNYTSKTVSVEFDVAKHNATITSVIVPTTNITVGQNAEIEVIMGNVITGTILIEIGGQNYTVPINQGKATLNIVLPKGTYTATAYFKGNEEYNAISLSNTTAFNVIGSELNQTVDVSIKEVTYPNTPVANVTVHNNDNGTVIIEVDGKQFSKELINGNAIIPLEGLSAGNKEAVVTVISANYNYDNVTTIFRINPDKSSIVISKNGKDVIATLNSGATGNVTFYINDKKLVVDIVGNQAVVENVLSMGTNVVIALYNGDENYTDSSTSATYVIGSKFVPELNVTVVDAKLGHIPQFYITVFNGPVAGEGTVDLTMNGITRTVRLIDGKGNTDFGQTLSTGTYKVTAVYSGDFNFESVSKNITFAVGGKSSGDLQKLVDEAIRNNQTELILTEDFEYNETSVPVIVNSTLIINGNGHTINGNGASGIFNITGDNVTLKDMILTKGNASDGGAVNWIGDNGLITQVVFNKNNATNGGALYIKGNNVTIEDSDFIENTADKGGAIYIKGNESAIHDSGFITNVAKIGGAIFIEGDENKVDNSTFRNNTAEIGGAIYILGKNTTVNNTLIINNTADSGAGIYVDGNNTKVINSTLQNNTASDLTNEIALDYGDIYIDELTRHKSHKPLLMRITKINIASIIVNNYDVSINTIIVSGDVVNSGLVYLTLNGTIYSALVNNSEATIKLNNLAKGNYNLKVNYINASEYGLSSTNATFTVIGVSKIIGNNLNLHYLQGGYYTIQALDAKGQPVAKASIQITIDGKIYPVTTDANGYASIKVNLKPGKYTATASTGNISTANTINVKHIISAKKTTKVKKSKKKTIIKITVKGHKINQTKNIKFKYKGKKTIKIKFGKVMKKQKVTVKFKSKTYTVKVNKKGVGKLKLNKKVAKKLKKGKKYKIKVTYVASKLYKKVKVTVKFKGKNYKVKTNKKAVAKFKVTKKMVKKIKKGKKVEYTITYKQDTVQKYVKIK